MQIMIYDKITYFIRKHNIVENKKLLNKKPFSQIFDSLIRLVYFNNLIKFKFFKKLQAF